MTFSLYDTITMMQPSEARDNALRKIEQHRYEWDFRRRPDQIPPFDPYWHTWIYSGGRGAGKTRTGAEEADKFARGHAGSRLLLVARTVVDARAILVEGESGILSLHGGKNGVRYNPALRQLEWRNGSKAFVTGSDEPDSIRGVEAHFGWADEVATWRTYKNKFDAWDHMRLAVRLRHTLDDFPRTIITTTPRKTKMLKKLHKELKSNPLGVRLTMASTESNVGNLHQNFLKAMSDMYDGTGMSETELEGQWPWKY